MEPRVEASICAMNLFTVPKMAARSFIRAPFRSFTLLLIPLAPKSCARSISLCALTLI